MAEIKKRNKNGKAKNSSSVTGGQTLLTHFMSQNKIDEVEKTLPPSIESSIGLAPQSFVEHSDPAIVAKALPSGASSPASSPLTSLPASSNPTSHCSSPTPMKLEIQEQPKNLFPIFEPHSTSQHLRANVAADTSQTKIDEGTLVRRNPKRKRTAAPPIESTVVSYKIRLPPPSAPALSTPSVSSSVIDLSSDEEEEPSIITIEDSPVRPRRHYTSKSANPLTSLHRTHAPSLKHRRLLYHEDNLLQSVFPDRLFQHVQGSQTSYTARSLPLRHRDKAKGCVGAHLTESSSLHFLGIDPHTRSELFATNDDLLASRDSDQERKTIPDHHRDAYPAISRLFDPPPYDQSPASRHTDPAQLYWNEKWRPRQAIEVLGNERNACYLRDWMNALRLHFDEHADQPSGSQRRSQRSQSSQKSKAGSQSTSRHKRKVAGRPLILREVNRSKKRQRRGELDWVVDDDVSEDELLIDDDYLDSLSLGNDEESLLPIQTNNGWSIHSKPFTFGSKIHNTLLLAGPSGSGKTAAIYACAEELGWEVFEVYPGIGKRGSVSLENLIGDVGKNHLVQQPRFRLEDDKLSAPIDSLPSTSAIREFFTDEAAKPPLRRLRRKTSQDDVVPVAVRWGLTDDVELPSKITDTPTIQVPQTNESFRQSIVLFEEVDVLFKDDVGFWPAVIKFIKDCKRPVVMTCNETSSIPTEDLPLQDILHFTPPPAPVVISYLRSVCLKERSHVDCEDHLERLAASSGRCPSGHRDLLVEHPEDKVSEASMTFPLDLRQTINQCQVMTINPFLLSSRIPKPGIEKSRGTALPSLSDNSNGATGEMNSHESLDDLLSLQRVTNSLSLLNANFSLLERHGAEVSEDVLDGQVGFLTLDPVSDRDLPVNPESYIRESEMVEAFIRSARGFVKADYTFLMDESSQPTNERYRSQMRDALGGRVPKAVSVLLESIVHLDYEPWIRYMVKAEEEDMKTTSSQRGRSTRNSQRGQFFTNMDTEKKDILAQTRLDVCGWDTTL